MSEPKKKVLLGMSGGVDSSVSAALLLEAGYEVIGAFMKNWSGTTCEDGSFQECGWRTERRDAMRVAAALDIPFMTFDFEEEYRAKVVENLFDEAGKGRTANPDVLCNKFVKFDLFVREADKLGCDFVATGHYARIEDGKILKGSDDNKDQSYFLWAIDPKILPRVLFPIGDMEKPDVRKKAHELGLVVADKKDSVGICFVGEVEMESFLKTRLPEEPGNIVNTDGKILGAHRGVHFFTIGQREGLGIGGGVPYYVVEKRPKEKELVVASNFHPSLFKETLTASAANWFREPKIRDKIDARIRYRQPVQPCAIESIEGDRVSVRFEKPQRAVTPGQSIVFYDGDEMLGGAIID